MFGLNVALPASAQDSEIEFLKNVQVLPQYEPGRRTWK